MRGVWGNLWSRYYARAHGILTLGSSVVLELGSDERELELNRKAICVCSVIRRSFFPLLVIHIAPFVALDISLYLRGPPPARISRSKTCFCQLHFPSAREPKPLFRQHATRCT